MKSPTGATIDQFKRADFETFLQERQQYLRNIYEPTDTKIKFDINKQNIDQKKQVTITKIENDKTLTTEQKKNYKNFIDSLKNIDMLHDDKINADHTTKSLAQLTAQDLKEITTYLSKNFDERDCPHNKFFAMIAWEKYEEKLKEKLTHFNSNFDKIKVLPQYNSVALTYEELKASWLELQSLPPTLTYIYDRNKSRDKLSNDNFDKEKKSLYDKITADDSIEKDTKTKLLIFVQSFTKSADKNQEFFSPDRFFPDEAAENYAKQLNEDDLKKIVTELRRYTLNDPLNYGLEDNWGGFNTYVFRNAFNSYFDKLKNLEIANEKDIDRLRREHLFPISNAYKFIKEQRKDFASELSEQKTIDLDSGNKVITDNNTLKTEIDSFRAEFTKEKYRDFEELGLDKNIVLEIISSNIASNPYSSQGAINVNFSNKEEHYRKLKCSDCLKVAKYFLNKSKERSESLHLDEDGSKKIQINTYLARVFFWLYEEKLPIEKFATSDDLKKLRTDIPFEYIDNESEITNLLKSKISKDSTDEFTRFFTNILNYDIDIDKALNEIYRDEQNRDKLKDFLQESDSKLAINLRKYILNKYDNIFDTPENRRSLLILKKYSAYGVFKTNSDPDRYEKHDLENAKTHLANDESVPHEVLNEKSKFTTNSRGILSLPPSPFSTRAVAKEIFSSPRERK